MLRISVLSQKPVQTVLKLEGRVTRSQVDLLEQELQRHCRGRQELVLDLDGISFLDPAGLDLLARWQRQGARLRGGSLFVKTLLRSRGLLRTSDLSPK